MKTLLSVLLILSLFSKSVFGDDKKIELPSQVLFTNVHVWDGTSDGITKKINVLIENNLIKKVRADINDAHAEAQIIDGNGKVLMPGLSDAHSHLTIFDTPSKLFNDHHWAYSGALMSKEANLMLHRGFTTIRDAGGPTYGLAKAINEGHIPGPRIYPSGHFIGQTSGHTDFRSYNEIHQRDRMHRSNLENNWAFLADGADEVRARTREVLRLGGTQIKLSVGGGVASPFDPIDTTQYSVDEIRAAVEAAKGWGTYVMVHAYHDESAVNALNAGAKSIDHGTLIKKSSTMKLMKEKGAFFVPQALIFSVTEEQISAFPPALQPKLRLVVNGLDVSLKLAKKHGVKIAFGTDSMGSSVALARNNLELGARLKWFEPIDILKQATSINGELFAMSGPRNPYKEGPLGIVQAGAYADLLLVDGNPLENITLLHDYENNIKIIMKDGKVYKNTLQN